MTRPDDDTAALPEEVFARELTSIAQRRATVGLNTDELNEPESDAPHTDRGLVGLALSGGGIRSSAFSLGVTQALAERDALARVDYVSTVSGGGYTGSMLSSVLSDPERADQPFPLAMPKGRAEPPALQHVRNCSNYLTPSGGLGFLRLPMVIIRGLLLNLLLFLPFIMLAVLFTELIHEWGTDLHWHMLGTESPLDGLADEYQLLIFIVPSIVVVYALAVAFRSREWHKRDRGERWATMVMLAGLLALVIVPLAWIVDWAIEVPLYGERGLMDALADWWSVRGWFVLAGAVGLAITIKVSAGFSRVIAKLGLALASLTGPTLLFALYLFLCVAQLDSPFLSVDSLGDMHFGEMSDLLRREMADKGIHYDDGPVPGYQCPGSETWLVPKPDDVRTCALAELCARGDQTIEYSCAYRLRPRGDHVDLIGARLRIGDGSSQVSLVSDQLFMVIMILVFLLNYFFIDINYSSMHGFYRDRLSRLYLFRLSARGAIESNDQQKLSELAPPGSNAPYHLLNATLNLQGSAQKSQRGRQSDVFFFSKHFCGSQETGYCETPALELWDPHLNLGTAMAISAAAASPNMGAMTLRPIVFIMTLLNVRLGYWLPNPARVRTRKLGRLRPRPRSRYLFREALGGLDGRTPLVNVSDGGHLENLGVYELLRRKCRLIIAVDAEADPTMRFNGLINVMRLAKIDLGIDIDIDVEPLRLGESGNCRTHFQVGTIDYGFDEHGRSEIGHLLYLKSSWVGDEDLVLRKFRADNPTFPHQTTADQFFREAQFEAYRALGEHIASDALADERIQALLDSSRSPAD